MERSTYSGLLPSRLLQVQSMQASAANTGDVNTVGYDSMQIMIDTGNFDDLGASPEGPAGIAVLVEHADDDGTGSAGTYSNVADTDIDSNGLYTVSSGVVTTIVDDQVVHRFSYIGSKKFIRVTLTPTGLGAAGQIGVWALYGHAHMEPV